MPKFAIVVSSLACACYGRRVSSIKNNSALADSSFREDSQGRAGNSPLKGLATLLALAASDPAFAFQALGSGRFPRPSHAAAAKLKDPASLEKTQAQALLLVCKPLKLSARDRAAGFVGRGGVGIQMGMLDMIPKLPPSITRWLNWKNIQLVGGGLLIGLSLWKYVSKGKKSVKAEPNYKYVAMDDEAQDELHEFCCEECGFTMFPARGREGKFFPDSYKCPMCGAPKESFFDMNDFSDPRTIKAAQEDEDFEYDGIDEFLEEYEYEDTEDEIATDPIIDAAKAADIIADEFASGLYTPDQMAKLERILILLNPKDPASSATTATSSANEEDTSSLQAPIVAEEDSAIAEDAEKPAIVKEEDDAIAEDAEVQGATPLAVSEAESVTASEAEDATPQAIAVADSAAAPQAEERSQDAAAPAGADAQFTAFDEKQADELHEFVCDGCGYTMFPARGREGKFFPKGFKCPMCGVTEERFFDMSDDTDPRTIRARKEDPDFAYEGEDGEYEYEEYEDADPPSDEAAAETAASSDVEDAAPPASVEERASLSPTAAADSGKVAEAEEATPLQSADARDSAAVLEVPSSADLGDAEAPAENPFASFFGESTPLFQDPPMVAPPGPPAIGDDGFDPLDNAFTNRSRWYR